MREFYKTVLPSSGDYFAVTIERISPNEGITRQKKVNNLDELLDVIESNKNKKNYNTYYAVGGFGDKKKLNKSGKEIDSRAADNCLYFKSFYLDLDCKGDDKSYPDKRTAIEALRSFLETTKLPKPVLVDSGNGVHPYWPLDRDIERDEWVSTASIFKDLCAKHGFTNDPTVVADAARIMRCPDTNNWNTTDGHPRLSKLLTPLKTFSYDDIKQKILSAAKEVGVEEEPAMSGYIRGELSEEVKSFIKSKYDDYETRFKNILALKDDGCAQINYLVANQDTADEPSWRAILTVAQACDDREKAIHFVSRKHPEYDYAATERKAQETKGPWRCETFESLEATRCKDCVHKGRITGPIELGRKLKQTQVHQAGPTVNAVTALAEFPPEIFPYIRGPNGGIYYQPPPEFDAKTKKKTLLDAVLVYPYDIEIYNRLHSRNDGETIAINVHLPLDPVKDFYIPLHTINSIEKFKEVMSTRGVVVTNKHHWEHLMSYTNKWAAYLQSVKSLTVMREQLGWSEDGTSFLLGETEYFADGSEKYCPMSPATQNVTPYLKKKGTFAEWKRIFNLFNGAHYENHAVMALNGFATPLMRVANVHGVMLNGYGKDPGTGKTVAVKGALSIFGSPRDLMVTKTTANARAQRLSMMNGIPYANDEQTNIPNEELSDAIYTLSLGSTKVRMNASSNSERANTLSFYTTAMTTSNSDFYEKLGDHRSDFQGEGARLIQLTFTAPPGLTYEIGKTLFDNINENYGHAAEVFIKYLVTHADEVKERVLNNCMEFNKDFGGTSRDRYWINWGGAWLTGAQIAQELGLHDIDINRVYKHLISSLQKILSNLEGTMLKAQDVLESFIYRNTSNMLVVDSTVSLKKTPGYIPARTPLNFRGLVMRFEPDINRVYINQADMRAYLKEHKFSPQVFEQKLREAGIMTESPKKTRIAAAWAVAPQTPVTAYSFNFKIDLDNIETEQTD